MILSIRFHFPPKSWMSHNNFLAVSYLSLFSQRQNNINQILTPTYLLKNYFSRLFQADYRQ